MEVDLLWHSQTIRSLQINDWRVCNHILTGWIEIMHWYSHYWLSVITHHISDIDLIEMYSVTGCMHYLYGNYSVFRCFCLLPIYTINLFSFACILRVLAWKVLKFFLQLTWLINEYNVLLVPKKLKQSCLPVVWLVIDYSTCIPCIVILYWLLSCFTFSS